MRLRQQTGRLLLLGLTIHDWSSLPTAGHLQWGRPRPASVRVALVRCAPRGERAGTWGYGRHSQFLRVPARLLDQLHVHGQAS